MDVDKWISLTLTVSQYDWVGKRCVSVCVRSLMCCSGRSVAGRGFMSNWTLDLRSVCGCLVIRVHVDSRLASSFGLSRELSNGLLPLGLRTLRN